MHITSIEIRNFKNIRHLRLDNIPSLVVIAGPNGTGKSSLFDALRLYKEAIASYSVLNPGGSWAFDLVRRIGPVITIGENEAMIKVSIRVSESESQLLQLPVNHSRVLTTSVVIRRNETGQAENVQPDTTRPDYPYLFRLFRALNDGNESDSRQGVIDHIGPDRRFARAEVTRIDFSRQIEEQTLKGLLLESEKKFENLKQDIIMMHVIDMQEREIEAQHPRLFIDGIRKIFEHFLPTTRFVGVDFGSGFGNTPKVLVRSGETTHDIDQLSSGQREILMTYTHLEKLRPKGSIILFDEPELHLHPALQRRVIDHLCYVLESGENQIWVITHSEEIVGTTEYESLFNMTGKGDPAIVPVKDQSDRIELLQHLGASIGLQLTSPRILFVEGTSDAELLPCFFGPLPLGISIVETGGKGDLMRSAPSAILLEKAIAEGKLFFIRDKDIEDDPQGIDNMAKKYKDRFFIWDRYHIENYLLDEEAIHQVLAEIDEIPKPKSAFEINAQLRDLADQRKLEVLAKYFESNLNRKVRKRIKITVSEGVKESLLEATAVRKAQTETVLSETAIEQLYATEKERLENRWDTDWKHLCIGRDILRAYWDQYVKPHYGYVHFRNNIARKIRELNRVPARITEVMSQVTDGLPGDGDNDQSAQRITTAMVSK